VRHDDLRALLPQYTAGRLAPAVTEQIRAHLAKGCDDCVRHVFGRRVESGIENIPSALVGTPGVRLIPLHGADGTRGHALWHPERHAVVVYAFDLPRLPGESTYQVHVRFPDRFVTSPQFEPDHRGQATTSIPIRGDAARLTDIVVVRRPGSKTILTGNVE